jgi:hypothetical protein
MQDETPPCDVSQIRAYESNYMHVQTIYCIVLRDFAPYDVNRHNGAARCILNHPYKNGPRCSRRRMFTEGSGCFIRKRMGTTRIADVLRVTQVCNIFVVGSSVLQSSWSDEMSDEITIDPRRSATNHSHLNFRVHCDEHGEPLGASSLEKTFRRRRCALSSHHTQAENTGPRRSRRKLRP